MTLEAIEWRKWWNQSFPDTAPVGFVLRKNYSERWLRIHSLPESKRYAESEDEYTELLRRHNAVATDALGEGALCYLFEGLWVDAATPEAWLIAGQEMALQFEVTQTVWNHGSHDALLREVADDKRPQILFAALDSGQVYSPYDGGADLIFCDQQKRDQRKLELREWLSEHPEGL